MLTAIEFDDQLLLDAAEINDEPSDRVLSPEFQIAERPFTQCVPQLGFRVGRLMAKRATSPERYAIYGFRPSGGHDRAEHSMGAAPSPASSLARIGDLSRNEAGEV